MNLRINDAWNMYNLKMYKCTNDYIIAYEFLIICVFTKFKVACKICDSNRKRNILSVDTESVSTDKISLLQINIELKRIKCEFQMKSNSLWKIPSTISSSRNLITLSYSGKTQISVCLLRNVRNDFFFFSFSTIAHLYFFFSPLPPIHTVSFDWFRFRVNS